jgi:sugar lactone lactonase YvrE
MLTLSVLACSTASAQTAHLSQVQTVLNTPSGFEWAQGLAVDSSGNLYIADQDHGRVVKLTPSNGGFIQSTIGTGLQYPGSVAVDSNNNVYIADYTLSTLLKETPNGSGGYTQSTIGSELNNAVSVAVDKNGNVFGVSNGELFKETLSGGVYTQSFLPTPGTHGIYSVVVDGNGDLFLVDGWDGYEVYEDIPLPGGGGYSTNELPGLATSLAVDSENNLYMAYYPGTISKLTSSGIGTFTTTGSIQTDSSFNDGDFYAINYGVDYFGAVAMAVDGNGNVFFIDGYTEELVEESTTSPANFGQVSVGSYSPYPVSFFFTFDSPGTMGVYGELTQGAPNMDFSLDTYVPDCSYDMNYAATEVCNIDVYFMPAAPGIRSGAVVLNDINGNPFTTAYVQGIGVSPLVAFPGAAPATYAGGLNAPLGTTVDASGNVLVANFGAKNVQLIAPGGAQSTIGTGFSNPTGVAEDGAGNIFVADNGSVYEIAKATGIQTQLTISGLTDPNDLAVDGAGNLYISEPNSGKVLKVTPAGIQTTVGTGLISPNGIAVDAGGNVYIADYFAGSIVIVAPSGTQSTISGFGSPTGVAVDAAGNVYVAVYGSGDLVEVSSSGERTTLASGLTNPYSVALDGNGNIYFTESAPGAVEKIDRVDAPSLNFASTQVGTASADSPKSVTLVNDGNAALSFPVSASGNNPGIAPNFTLQSGEPSACPLVPAGSSQPGTLAAGTSCVLPVSFVPASAGNISGALTLTDNSLNAAAPNYATQSIQLQGTGTQSLGVLTSPTPGLSTVLGTANVTFQWSPGVGVALYQLSLSVVSAGASDLYLYKGTATSAIVPALPANGAKVYATLYSKINGVWQSNSYLYTESGTPAPAALTSPAPGITTILATSNITFQWTSGIDVADYQLNLSAIAPGDSDLYFYKGAASTTTAPSLPANGAEVYARLYSKINGTWQYNDYVYTEGGTPTPAALTSPSPGSNTVLGSSNVTFQWTAGIAVTDYQLNLSAVAPGESDLYLYKGAALTTAAPTLPTNGVEVYARLYSYINGVWQHNDYVYTESGTPILAVLTYPTPGLSTVLGTSNVLFQWTAGTGVSLYQLNLSAVAPGGSELYLYKGTATSANVPSLPANSAKVYATLYSYINGAWQQNDYVYKEQ